MRNSYAFVAILLTAHVVIVVPLGIVILDFSFAATT